MKGRFNSKCLHVLAGRGISLMDRSDNPKCTASMYKPLLSLMILVGVGLFITGFVMTVSSLSDMGASSSGSGPDTPLSEEADTGVGSDGIMLLTGLTLSLVGVVAATAAPAAFYIHGRNRSS